MHNTDRKKVLAIAFLIFAGLLMVGLLISPTKSRINSFASISSSEDPWPMFRHDPQHTGYTTSKSPYTLRSLWNATTYGPGAVTSSPSVVNGKVFVGADDNNLYVANESTGSIMWVCSTASSVHSSPAVKDGLVFVGSNDEILRALNESNGIIEWSQNLGSPIYSSPCAVNGDVYVASTGKPLHIVWEPGKVYCLDMYNGSIKWMWEWPPPISGYWQVGIFSSPAVYNGIVYFGADYYWQDGYGSENGRTRIFAINATDGNQLWQNEIYLSWSSQGPRVYSSAAIAENKIFIGCDDHYLYCLKEDTGDLLWKFGTDGEIRSSPAVGDTKVVFGSNDGKVYCLSQSGGKLWTYTTGGAVRSSPVLADEKIFVGSDDGYLYVLDENTGALLDNYLTSGAVESSPAIVDEKIFFGSSDGHLYALLSAEKKINNPIRPINIGDVQPRCLYFN